MSYRPLFSGQFIGNININSANVALKWSSALEYVLTKKLIIIPVSEMLIL